MSRAWDALQRLTQNVTTVTRSARVDIVGGGVDEIDPPEDLDEYAELARNTGVINKNLRQFTNDVWEPGYRVEAESEETVDFFTGGDNAPEETPEGGFLENAAVFAGERHQDFYSFGKECTWQRWARGTVTIELLRDDQERITGFHFIRPETLYPQVENNTNILLPPDTDNLPSDVSERDITLTDRGEVAAYIQFDDESILGLRNDGFGDKQEVPLSQNDVVKQVLDADIGDDYGSETQGVFGTSAIAGIAEDVEEYKQIKRDRARAIQTKAYGIWGIEYGREVLDLGTEKRLIEWEPEDMDEDQRELENLGPGEIAQWDGTKNLKRFDSDVPDLEETIKQYISIITAPLPTPKYLVGFAGDINRDISTEQKTGYDDLKSEERRYQHTSWTDALKRVAESWGLDTTGLQLKVEEREESNPIKAWDSGQMERASTYISSLAEAAGPQAGPTALVDREAILEILDFPVDEMEDGEAEDALAELESELDSDVEREAWRDVMGVEALQEFSEGTWVDTPDGKGLVEDTVSEGTVGGMDANEEPVVVVAMVESEGVNFYRESDLSESSEPGGPESPEEELEAMANIAHADADMEALQFGEFDYPESWEESETPNRVILLKAYAGMGGSFTGCRSEGLRADLCASIKDAVLGTHDWRGGWAD